MPDVPAKPYDQEADNPIQNLRYVVAKLRTDQNYILANIVEVAVSELVTELIELKSQIEQKADTNG